MTDAPRCPTCRAPLQRKTLISHDGTRIERFECRIEAEAIRQAQALGVTITHEPAIRVSHFSASEAS